MRQATSKSAHELSWLMGPLRPLMWLVMLSIAGLAIALLVLSFSDVSDSPQKAVTLHKNEVLIEDVDFSANQWFKDFNRVPLTNIRPYHVIEIRMLRRDRSFSHPFTLNFSSRAFDVDGRPEGVMIARYDDTSELWQPVGGEAVPGNKPVAYRYTDSQPGYYAMCTMLETKGQDTLPQDPIAKGFQSDFIDVPIWVADEGKWETRKDLRLRITPSQPTQGKPCVAKIAASPEALKRIIPDGTVMSCRWYLIPWDQDRFPRGDIRPDDVELDHEVAEIYSDTTEKEAFSFTVPTDQAGNIILAFEVEDPLSGADRAVAFFRLRISDG